MNLATVLPIQGTFDIALARRALRAKIATRRWPTSFNARAAASLTALGELVLLPCVAGLSVVRINFDGGPALEGIAYSSDLKLTASDSIQLAEALQRLERASDDIEIQETRDGILVNVRVWVH